MSHSKRTGARCDPDDIATKSFFLGPQAENAVWADQLASSIFSRWYEWRRNRHSGDGKAISEADQALPRFQARRDEFRRNLDELIRRYEDELSKFSPRYIGHMVSEISLPALFGHFVTLLHNPNNVSGEASRVGVQLEREAIGFLREMFGFDEPVPAGHFTSGGTVANFEGLVRARQRLRLWLASSAEELHREGVRRSLFEASHRGWEGFRTIRDPQSLHPALANPFDAARFLENAFGTTYRGPVLLAPVTQHYSWKKGLLLMGLGDESAWPVEVDRRGRLSVGDLASKIERAEREQRPVLMVVSVAGTTEMGSVDPVNEVQDLLGEYARERGIHIWHHVDAAFGGFFSSLLRNRPAGHEMALDPEVAAAFGALSRADSLTLDPHKLGYVPYACGAFIARTWREYELPPVDAPYVAFTPGDHGLYTLEGSRSAAGAAATWLTARTIGLDADGYGRILSRGVRMRKRLEHRLKEVHPSIRIAPHLDTNIICFHVAEEGEPLSVSNERTRRVTEAFAPDRDSEFIVSKTELRFGSYDSYLREWIPGWNGKIDAGGVLMVRMVLMNPFLDSKETRTDYLEEFCRSLLRVIHARR